MEVKNVFVVVICIIPQLYQIAYADLVPIHVKEVIEFCENNGHKYLTIFDDGLAAENQKNILLMKQGK